MKTRTVSEENKQLCRYVAEVLGGTPKVIAHADEEETHFVDILECSDQPVRGVTSYSTIGLSDHPLTIDGNVMPFRIELCAACDSRATDFSNVLATAAFFIIKDGWAAAPGVVFEEMLDRYPGLSPTMRHLYFMAPFLWENLETISLPGKDVAWLQAIPISGAESDYHTEHGPEALENLFQEAQIDVFDLSRSSVAPTSRPVR